MMIRTAIVEIILLLACVCLLPDPLTAIPPLGDGSEVGAAISLSKGGLSDTIYRLAYTYMQYIL